MDCIPDCRTPLHAPPATAVEQSQMRAFWRRLEQASGRRFNDFSELHRFSVEEQPLFWREFIDWSRLIYEGDPEPVLAGDDVETARFFPELRLSYAENLLARLAPDDDDWTALVALAADGQRRTIGRGALRRHVAAAAAGLRSLGLKPGDRVAAIARNGVEAVIAALATAAVGASFTSLAPETGAETIRDRFQELKPRLLLAHLAALPHDRAPSLRSRVAQVAGALPTLEALVSLDDAQAPGALGLPAYSLSELIAAHADAPLIWERFPFDHPLYIMFSSGTTGRPKGIIQTVGGMVLKPGVEQRLHLDLRPRERVFFYSSTSWVIWSLMLSTLAIGSELVLLDGPISEPDLIWRIAEAERVAVLGTSPAYLKMSEERRIEPARDFDLGALRMVVAAGAVLHPSQHRWARDHLGDVPVHSMYGSTESGSLLVPNPVLPIYAGDCTGPCLTIDVDVELPPEGGPIGDVVVRRPFISKALGFVGDPDGSRFREAYFSQHPGVFTLGDLVEFTPERSARLHGRSDGVLNIRGLRVGPAEVYRHLQDFDEIADMMIVEQRQGREAGRERSVLLLVLRPGAVLDGALSARIRRRLAERASPGHVPDLIIEVPELPVTHNGKRSEAAMTAAINGLPVRNLGSLANPESLEAVRRHPALRDGAQEADAASAETTEEKLRAIWEGLFQFRPIGLQDDFFELGGQSYLATRLFAEIAEHLGRDLPISTLLHASTIEELAAVIEKDLSPSARLVEMHGGTGRPFFMIHSLAGTVLELWAVARAMRTERPVWGIQARGLGAGEEEPETSVEAMAREYIGLMKSVQPQGPYALGGYSFGGLVAYEMARQLKAAGEAVELLCLIDTMVHPRFLPGRQGLHYRYVRPFARALEKPASGDRLGHFAHLATVAFDRLRMRFGLQPLRAPQDIIDSSHLPAYLRRIRGGIMAAMTNYRPGRYGGDLTYLYVTEDRTLEPIPFFRRAVEGRLTLRPIPGDHNSTILEPHAQVLAQTLDDLLAATRQPAAIAA